jgi:CHASE2 domain-containing sensor protein
MKPYKELKNQWWFRMLLLGLWAVTGGAITWYFHGREFAIGVIACGMASLALALVLFLRKMLST